MVFMVILFRGGKIWKVLQEYRQLNLGDDKYHKLSIPKSQTVPSKGDHYLGIPYYG